MPDKEAPEPTNSAGDPALEKRVEVIMGRPPEDSNPSSPPPIDIFKDPATAPQVPATLLKQISSDDPPAATPGDADTPLESPQPAADTPTATDDVPKTPLDDAATDKAVNDIVVNEGDVVLAAEDAAAGASTKIVKPTKGKHGLHGILKNKWLWLGLGLIVVAVFALPQTRYTLLGLVLKESVSIDVQDSKTNTPVSNALISLDGVTSKTDASGKAVMKVSPGKSTLTVTKQYYKTYSQSYFTGLKSGNSTNVTLVATGRQVPITVLNKITGKPLSGADIDILDTSAKTNQKGQATIVLPTSSLSYNASVALSGYNTAHAPILVTSSVVSTNTISLTPAGTVYFLSNLSGTIDVVKTNLDGSNRQTVLAGTGKEDPNTTSLLASRDWRYLVLKSQRDTAQPALYLIDTTTDKVTEFDSGDATFTLIGWYGHNFVYDVEHTSVPNSQSGHEAIKSYDADTGQLNQLDQNQVDGTATDYAYQSFNNFYIVNGLVTYNTQWYTYDAGGTTYDLSSKSDTIRVVQPTGQGKKDYQSFPALGVGYIQAALYEPQSVYYAVYNYSSGQTAYYQLNNQTVTTVSNLTQTTFNQTYPTYLVSPSGDQTFWTEQRDGKNTLFTGDQNAQNQKQIASLSDYSPYGWYSDNYVLVSENSSELYIMPASGLSSSQQPLKITDYFKPTQTYTGYGYGYGGL